MIKRNGLLLFIAFQNERRRINESTLSREKNDQEGTKESIFVLALIENEYIYIYIGKIIDFSFPGFKRFSDVKGHGSRITVSETSRGILKNSVKVRIKGTGEERMMRRGRGEGGGKKKISRNCVGHPFPFSRFSTSWRIVTRRRHLPPRLSRLKGARRGG